MSKQIRVAINGTGRIGLCVARIIGQRDDVELVCMNSTSSPDILSHLLEYDSIHGSYSRCVSLNNNNTIDVGNSKGVVILSNRGASGIDFSNCGANCVLECTGKLNSMEKSSIHLQGQISNVVISAPASGVPTFVYGVNHASYAGEKIISNASCTTNCLAPIAKILNDNFGIQSAFMTTVHSYTNDQNVLDSKHSDKRRARACSVNMIPTSTGAAKAIGLVIPELDGKMNGLAVRVPTPNVSLLDLSANLSRETSVDEVLELFNSCATGDFSGILEIDNDERVSSDFCGSSASAVVLADSVMMLGKRMIKVLAWYDNEIGYSHRLVDMLVHACKHC